MDADALPLLLEPEQLEAHLGDDELLLVDLCRPETYLKFHIPGAVHLDYADLVQAHKPIMGLLPSAQQLGRVLGAIGLTPELQVVAYDDEGGGRAARLLWTLDVLGHRRLSLLNGGLHAWANEAHELENHPVKADPADYAAHIAERGVADKSYVLAHLDDPDVLLLDARTPEEFAGAKRLAARGGHIPGAVNLDWLQTMDRRRNLRLLPADVLRSMLQRLGATPDKEIVTYCQSHHRSSHSYVMLKWLEFTKMKGYPGAWSEWGNDPSLPVEM